MVFLILLDNEQHFNNDQGNARKNVIKKNEPVKKPVTTKEQEKYKDMEEYGKIKFIKTTMFIQEKV